MQASGLRKLLYNIARKLDTNNRNQIRIVVFRIVHLNLYYIYIYTNLITYILLFLESVDGDFTSQF